MPCREEGWWYGFKGGRNRARASSLGGSWKLRQLLTELGPWRSSKIDQREPRGTLTVGALAEVGIFSQRRAT